MMPAPRSDLVPIDFDDLARHSVWPKRLLGLETFGVRQKSELEVLREFQQERWHALLERVRDLRHPTLSEVERIYNEPTAIGPCYVDGSFYLASQKQMLDAHLDLYAEVLAPYIEGASCLVELGAGYGSKLLGLSSRKAFLSVPLAAGEFTQNGRDLISLLATHLNKSVSVGHCDFRTLTTTDLRIPEGAVIFTSYAAHYVPEMPVDFVRFLARFKPRAVVHFEPCYEYFDQQSLHGLMCRRYMELNDYTRNLASVIEAGQRQEGISVRVRKNVLGSNPFLPLSVIEWSPAGQ